MTLFSSPPAMLPHKETRPSPPRTKKKRENKQGEPLIAFPTFKKVPPPGRPGDGSQPKRTFTCIQGEEKKRGEKKAGGTQAPKKGSDRRPGGKRLKLKETGGCLVVGGGSDLHAEREKEEPTKLLPGELTQRNREETFPPERGGGRTGK